MVQRLEGVRSVLEALDIPALVMREDGVVLACGRKAGAIFEIQPADMVGHPLAAFLPEDTAPDLAEDVAAIVSGEAERLELAVLPKQFADLPGFRRLQATLEPFDAGTEHRAVLLTLAETATTTAAAPHPSTRMLRLEERLKLATEAGGIGVWEFDVASGRLEWDDTMHAMFGMPRETFRGRIECWRRCVHPDDIEQSEAKFAEALKSGTRLDDDIRILRPGDGQERFMHASARVVRDDRGRPLRIVGVTFDITERKEAERRAVEAWGERQRSLELLNRLADNAPCALYELKIDVDGKMSFPFAARGIEDVLGVPLQQLMQDAERGFQNVEPRDLPDIKAKIRESAENLSPFLATFRLNHPKHGTRWTTARSLPHRLDDGGTLWYGAMFDSTVREEALRQVEEANRQLRQAHVRLNTLTENSATALFELRVVPGESICIPYFSPKLPSITGVDEDAIRADSLAFAQHVHPDDIHLVYQAIDRVRTEEKTVTFKHRLRHPVRGLRWVMSSMMPVREQDGTLILYCSMLDVTEQEQATARAAAATEETLRAHEKMVTMAENTPGAFFEWLMDLDRSVQFEFFSAQLPELLGVTSEDLVSDGACVFQNIPPDEGAAIRVAVEHAADTLSRFELRHRVIHPTNGLRWVLVSANPILRSDGRISWYGNTVDITDELATEQRAAEAAEDLRRAHERLTSVAEIAPVGLYEFHWKSRADIEFTYASAHFEDLVGLTKGDAQELKAFALQNWMHPDEVKGYLDHLEASSLAMTPRRRRFRQLHPRHGLRWLAVAETPRAGEDGDVIWTGAMIDVTADVEREAKLKHLHETAETMRAENERQALHDGLTALPNRRYYDKMLAERLARAREGVDPDCVLIRLDLDHFKHVNDTLGHEAGDKVLVRVADVLRESLRQSDFAARIGGDEYSILLAPGFSETDAVELVERVQKRLREPLIHEGRQCRFGASFGIAATDDLAEMGEDIQMFADAALYRAKAGGRNRMERFTPHLHKEIMTDRRLAVELHEGLDNDEFVPFFQPQVSAENGELVGIETLLRWKHPRMGILAPGSFMHVAEQLRLVPDIDRVMMEKARDALARWARLGHHVPKISFNVSAGRMHDPDVVALARSMVAHHTKVTFELLESILVEEENDVFRYHLDVLRDLGIDIEIDDFGSGHASIIGLMQIGPSALKIDQRIVQPVADDDRSRNLVRAIVEIADTLGIGTVAEGVETAEQAAILKEIGCNALQGYLFSYPLSEDKFLRYLGHADLRLA